MKSVTVVCLSACFGILPLAFADHKDQTPMIYPDLAKYIERRVSEFDQISAERKSVLGKISKHVDSRMKNEKTAKLVFICTHNSRRSQISQIFAMIAARHYGISNIESYSGGTEVTAFNPRAVSALQRCGVKIEKLDDAKNPKYAVRFHDTMDPLICFSKTYRDPANPTSEFCAVMTCSEADANCPVVSGCLLRIPLPFEDPKIADDSPDETAKYDERCARICRELLFVFSQFDQNTK